MVRHRDWEEIGILALILVSEIVALLGLLALVNDLLIVGFWVAIFGIMVVTPAWLFIFSCIEITLKDIYREVGGQ